MLTVRRTILTACFLFGCFVLSGANQALAAAQTSAKASQSGLVKYRVGLPSGARAILPGQRVGGRVYLNIEDVAKALFDRAPLIEGGIAMRLDAGILRCPAVSFYVALESSDGVRVAQMAYPSIERNRKLYLPAEPFFRALQVLGLYLVERGKAGDYRLRAPARQLTAAWNSSAAEQFRPGPVGKSNYEEVETTTSNYDGVETGNKRVQDSPYVAPELSTPDHYRIPADLHVRSGSGTGLQSAGQEYPAATLGNSTGSSSPPNQAGQSRYDTRFETPVRGFDSLMPSPRRQYVLPPDLRRRERVLDSSQSAVWPEQNFEREVGPADLSSSMISGVSAPLASLLEPALLAAPASVNIRDVRATIAGGVLNLRFEAGTTISSYQRPEFNGTRLIIRFPEASHKAENWVELPETEGIAAVAQENIRGIQVYRLRFDSGIKEVKHKRLAGNVIEFSVQLAEKIDANERLARESQKWKLDVIVIDPGHGGKDPGAIGVTGVREKDVVLKLSLLLGKMIEEKMPETKVVFTRDDDTFVELFRRGQMANEAGGKLFISVHANSVAKPSKTARGFETFILRPGRNEDAVKVAERENSVIKFEQNVDRYKTLTDEEFIVVNMAQKAFVKFSEKFATMLQEEIDKSTPLNNRGVNQAGFFVLVGASMPNVLFEAAFLSNKSDEKYLNSDKGIQQLAEGMFNSIVRYRDYLEKVNAAGN